MPRPSSLVTGGLLFLVFYGLLLAPWPGWDETYGQIFRRFGAACFSWNHGELRVRFERAESPPRPEIDTAILLPTRVSSRLQAKILGLDSRSVGWVPTALVIALTLATPVPWRRRLKALALSLVLVHAYVVAVLAIYLWNQSGGLVPVSFLPFSTAIGDGLEETFVTQLGPSFVVPVVIWLAVTFRTGDRPRLPSRARAKTPPVPRRAGSRA